MFYVRPEKVVVFHHGPMKIPLGIFRLSSFLLSEENEFWSILECAQLVDHEPLSLREHWVLFNGFVFLILLQRSMKILV